MCWGARCVMGLRLLKERLMIPTLDARKIALHDPETLAQLRPRNGQAVMEHRHGSDHPQGVVQYVRGCSRQGKIVKMMQAFMLTRKTILPLDPKLKIFTGAHKFCLLFAGALDQAAG